MDENELEVKVAKFLGFLLMYMVRGHNELAKDEVESCPDNVYEAVPNEIASFVKVIAGGNPERLDQVMDVALQTLSYDLGELCKKVVEDGSE